MASLWHTQVKTEPREPLCGDVHTDVLIVGGGLSGILLAHSLASKGVDSIVVEAARVGSGVTGNTTAKITAQHGLLYSEIARARGLGAARMYYEINTRAIARFSALAKDFPCDFEEKTAYVYTERGEKKLLREAETYRALGIEPLLVEKPDLPVRANLALGMKKQAQFSPLKLLSALSSRLKVYEGTKILSIDGHEATFDGGRVRAEHIVLATHYPLVNIPGLYFMKLYQSRSYVLALSGAPPVKALFVDEREDGFSFRDANGLLLIGGGDHRTGMHGGGFPALKALAESAYPGAEARFMWATQDAMTLDGLPYVGRHSRAPKGLYVMTGYNKWGMTGSMAAAEVLTELITSGESEYAFVYDPARSMMHKRLFVNGFHSALSLVTPSAPRCTHMGCALHENTAEGSFDCPCHGSRFTKSGRVLDNPAVRDLQPEGFYGRYYKHQLSGHTLSLIAGRAKDEAFIQIITNEKSFITHYPLSEFKEDREMRVGGSVFSKSGIKLDVHESGATLTGKLTYGALMPLRYDYMGPFRAFPMECRHEIVSLRHEVAGEVSLNGECMDFTGALGYIEGDSGTSFPRSYTWVQCSDFEIPACVSAAVARVPFLGFAFRGCVAIVWLDGQEYRLATYKGARVTLSEPGKLSIRQGKLNLLIEADVDKEHLLLAPMHGRMERGIRESASCHARFIFSVGGKALLNAESRGASVEIVNS